MKGEVSLSLHLGGDKNRTKHNMRDPRVTAKEKHIDPMGRHEVWKHEDPRAAYDRLFSEAIKEYNAKQAREDRKIKDYYTHIGADKKKHQVYELVVAVGGKDESGLSVVDDKTGKEILKVYTETWEERNTHLELIGAYYHADEEGQPHIHIDFIPVAEGYSKGPARQTGLVKALGAQGFKKKGKETAQIAWEASERDYLESLVRARGYGIRHEGGHRYLEVKEYKAMKEIERLENRVAKAKELEAKAKPAILDKKKVTLNKEDYEKLVATATKVEDVEDWARRNRDYFNRKIAQAQQATKEAQQTTKEAQETIRKYEKECKTLVEARYEAQNLTETLKDEARTQEERIQAKVTELTRDIQLEKAKQTEITKRIKQELESQQIKTEDLRYAVKHPGREIERAVTLTLAAEGCTQRQIDRFWEDYDRTAETHDLETGREAKSRGRVR